MVSIGIAIAIGISALAGGFIDAISGGGGLLTIPALLICGIPPHYALGTNKIGAFLGTSVSLFNFGKHGLVNWHMAAIGVPFSVMGSWAGSLLALQLDPALLGKILVVLLPIAMIATLMPRKKRDTESIEPGNHRLWIALPIICTLLGAYDGFFGPGAGSFLILALYAFLRIDLIAASATAKAFNLASNVSAAVAFLWHGAVLWSLGLIMAACFMAGNLLGSQFAIKAGAGAVRKFLIVSLALLMATLIWRYFISPFVN